MYCYKLSYDVVMSTSVSLWRAVRLEPGTSALHRSESKKKKRNIFTL